ncbi:MAG: sulfatase [Planctomycetes bacterium]|nr:sulfatase [Planctomycetota bacterium]
MFATRALCCCIVAATLVACDARTQLDRRPNVLVVLIDSMRADHVGWLGYDRHETTPRLDRLANEAFVFTDASSTASATRPSVPSIFTGSYPAQHGLYGREGDETAPLADEAWTLAESFAANGWRTGAFVYNPQLAAGNGFEQGFEHYEQREMDAAELCERADAWLSTLDGEPFFAYLHFLDTHTPYSIPPEAASRFAPLAQVEKFQGTQSWAVMTEIDRRELPSDDPELDALRALYDGALRHVDDQLALLFDELARRGEWDDTIVCVLADHGEDFMERGRIGHGHGLWQTMLHVPWLLRVPGVAARRVETPVSLIDVFATLHAAAGLPVPAAQEGIDRTSAPDARRPIYAELKDDRSYLQAFRVGDRKLIRRFAGAHGSEDGAPLRREDVAELIRTTDTPAGGLYDLADDPGEKRPVFEGPAFDELQDACSRFGRDLLERVHYQHGERRKLPAEELERLRQLGY